MHPRDVPQVWPRSVGGEVIWGRERERAQKGEKETEVERERRKRE